MNPQFKKGVLELIVLESVRKKDMYGYELVEEVSKVVDLNERGNHISAFKAAHQRALF